MTPPNPSPLHGVVTAMITPLTAAGTLDETAWGRLLERQVVAGVQALFILGSVGEGPLLPPETNERAVRLAVQTVQRRRPVLAGASDNSTELCLRRIEQLATWGVDYAVLTLPYYGWSGQRAEALEFYGKLAQDSPLPFVAYNLPKAVGWRMPVELLEELCTLGGQLVAIKDTHAEVEEMVRMAGSPRRPLERGYLPGNSALAGLLMAHGADGVVSTPANIYPRLFVEQYRCHRAGETARLASLEPIVDELCRLLSMPSGPAGIKCALEQMGLCQRHTVRPWPVAGVEQAHAIAGILHKVRQAMEALGLGPAD